MSISGREQSVRNAWTNILRDEVLRVRRAVPEVPRIANVGVWLATYADADGGGAFPSRTTLAALAGASTETVTRAVKVLVAVGMLERRRRPNQSSVYQLLTPLQRPDWAAHIHLYTDSRQRRAHARKKEEDAAARAALAAGAGEQQHRKASTDGIRTASTPGVPDDVHGRSPQEADSVHGRPRKASTDGIRTASTPGSYQYPSTYGRDPLPDHNMAAHSPQPQQRAGEQAQHDHSSPGRETTTPPEPSALHAVPAAAPSGRPGKGGPAEGQRPLLLSVQPHPDTDGPDVLEEPPYGRCTGDSCTRALVRPGKDLCPVCAHQAAQQLRGGNTA